MGTPSISLTHMSAFLPSLPGGSLCFFSDRVLAGRNATNTFQAAQFAHALSIKGCLSTISFILVATCPLLQSEDALEKEAHAIVESKELETIAHSRISITCVGAVICRSAKHNLQQISCACGW